MLALNRSPAGSPQWHAYRDRVTLDIWRAAYRPAGPHSSRRIDGALDPARPKRDPRPVKNRRSK